MTTVIEHSSGRRARGKLYASPDAAEASFKRRRSPDACMFRPRAYQGFYGDDFGPDMWFVGLYLDAEKLPKEPGWLARLFRW